MPRSPFKHYAYTSRILEVSPQNKRQAHPAAGYINAFIQFSLCILGFAAGSLYAQIQSNEEAPSAGETDWISMDQLSPEQRLLVPDACCGLFLEPAFPLNEAGPDTALINAESAEIISNDETDIISFMGDTSILYNQLWFQADGAGIFDRNAATLDLSGNVQIRQPGILLRGSRAFIDQQSNNSELQDASYLLHEQRAHGSAEVIVYTDADGIVTISNGIYSRCEPGDNSWLLRGEYIELDQESGRGVARNVTLRVRDIPVLYVPYFSFPINDERSTGFLNPGFGSTRDGGLEITIPYYLNLAPNYDATLSPRIMTERGVMLGLEGRYMNDFSTSILDLNYLHDDKLFDSVTAGQAGSDSPPRARRWQINYQAEARFTENFKADADFMAISDADYFQDFGSTGFDSTTLRHLDRSLNLTYLQPEWSLLASVQSYQLIDRDIPSSRTPYSSLPRINFDSRFYQDDGFSYGLDAEYVYFDRSLDAAEFTQVEIDDGMLVTGQRLALEPVISWSWTQPGMFLKPEAKYRYAQYQLSDQALGRVDDPDRGVFTGSIDGGLIFEREISFEETGYFQTLEPRLYYLFSEYEDQNGLPVFDTSDMNFSFNQLFRDNRFSGRDRVGDSNQLTLALSSRFLDQARQEKVRLGLGQIFYFEDRRINLSNTAPERSGSAVVGEFSYQLNEQWQASAYQEWNPYDKSLDTGSFQFRYQSAINRIFNFSYRYRDSEDPLANIDQTDLSVIWPLAANWGFLGRWNYDHDNKRNLESMLGLEYSNCCWDVRLIARQWIDNSATALNEKNSGIFLQFELKGLGSVLGGRSNESITGFRTYEYAQ